MKKVFLSILACVFLLIGLVGLRTVWFYDLEILNEAKIDVLSRFLSADLGFSEQEKLNLALIYFSGAHDVDVSLEGTELYRAKSQYWYERIRDKGKIKESQLLWY